ncbi:MAG: SRPBCC domain-containing protein [Alphaproteobacteria bacterium]
MTQLTHDSFVIEHSYKAAPAQVFKAWSNSDAISQWAPPMEGMVFEYTAFNFTPGGAFEYRCGPQGAMVIKGGYLDIVQDQRILFTEVGAVSDGGVSVMMNTVDLVAEGSGTKLIMTVQIAASDAAGTKQGASFGWGKALTNLEGFL